MIIKPDVVVVDLDDGHVSVPSTVVLLQLPDQLKEAVENALAEVLHPSIKQRDYVFTQDFNESRSIEIQVTYCMLMCDATCTCMKKWSMYMYLM